MENLIELENLISELKKNNIDMGKGDPYNRLRYYTKIGWLPNMKRKMNSAGELRGHYPRWVIKRITKIESLRKQGLSNDEISSTLDTQNIYFPLYNKITDKKFVLKVSAIAIITLLTIGILVDRGLLKLYTPKNFLKINNETSSGNIEIIDSGKSIVTANRNKTFVKTNKVDSAHKIYITFNSNYSPANRYWISQVENGKGFFIELDAPLINDANFSWWVSY